MLVRSKFTCLLSFVVVLGEVQAYYVAVNWNISTDRGNSYFEREYKYPMYEDVAPVPCDLTNSCDVFCHQDPDCDEWQKRSFLEVPPNALCSGPLAFFRCDCDNFYRPEWFSILCFVFRNPIYLGKFYKTAKKIEKFGGLRNVIDQKQYNMFKHNLNGGEMKSKVINQLGAPVMTFVPMSDSFPSLSPLLMKIPVKDFSYACESKPVRYRINDSTVCLTRISQEQCQNGHALSILPYLVQGDNFANSGKIPIVLKDLDVLKGTKTNVTIKCVAVKLKSKKFKKQDINYFQEEMSKACHGDFKSYQTFFSNDTCLNVLTSVKYKFTLNGSDVVNLTVEYSLADLPLHFDNNNKSIQRTVNSIYLKQTFAVNFFDILKKSPDTRNFTKGDNLLNRGYFMGEKLNFGYKHIKNSSTSWENGDLGIFGSGDSCSVSSPITFGFDYFSVCRIRRKFYNCSHLRNEVEEKFEALVRGDSLAVYANLRSPYNSSVPLLRSHSPWNSSAEGSEDASVNCLIPVIQDVLIRYTTTLEHGNAVHRVSGIGIDRTFRKVIIQEDVLLTSRALFFRGSSSRDKTSRFWKRMSSPEMSENSWLHILDAFDDVTPEESEEITFWCIFLVLLVSVAFACTGLDPNPDFFFSSSS